MTNPYQSPNPQDPYGSPAQPYSPSDPYAQSYPSGNYSTSPSQFDQPAPQYNQYDAGYANYSAQPAPYAAPGVVPSYGVAQQDHPQTTMVFVLGLLSVLGVSITGPFAWYMGSKARREIQQNPGQYKENGMLTGGWVMGIIGTVFLGFWILYFIFWMIIMFVAIATTPTY